MFIPRHETNEMLCLVVINLQGLHFAEPSVKLDKDP
jgi:hypothetical protein